MIGYNATSILILSFMKAFVYSQGSNSGSNNSSDGSPSGKNSFGILAFASVCVLQASSKSKVGYSYMEWDSAAKGNGWWCFTRWFCCIPYTRCSLCININIHYYYPYSKYSLMKESNVIVATSVESAAAESHVYKIESIERL